MLLCFWILIFYPRINYHSHAAIFMRRAWHYHLVLLVIQTSTTSLTTWSYCICLSTWSHPNHSACPLFTQADRPGSVTHCPAFCCVCRLLPLWITHRHHAATQVAPLNWLPKVAGLRRWLVTRHAIALPNSVRAG